MQQVSGAVVRTLAEGAKALIVVEDEEEFEKETS